MLQTRVYIFIRKKVRPSKIFTLGHSRKFPIYWVFRPFLFELIFIWIRLEAQSFLNQKNIILPYLPIFSGGGIVLDYILQIISLLNSIYIYVIKASQVNFGIETLENFSFFLLNFDILKDCVSFRLYIRNPTYVHIFTAIRQDYR